MLKIKLEATLLLILLTLLEFYFLITNNTIWMIIGLIAMILLAIITEVKKALYKNKINKENNRIIKENNENLKIIANEIKNHNK